MRQGSSLIVVFDGLRRDHATVARMPNLAGFIAQGVDFPASRSVFPSETRVAVASLVTGCAPAAHGLVANAFHHPAVIAGRPFQTAAQADLRAADAAGLLLDRPSLGERISAAGGVMAVVSTASPGATWLLHHRAAATGQLVFSTHGPDASASPAAAEALIDRFGPIPPAATPNTDRLHYAATVLTEHVYPELKPDLAVLWFSDPDGTSHRFGIAAPETAAAQRGADATFGRVLDWWRTTSGPRPETIVVLSDHGQITGRAEIDLAAALPDLRDGLVPGYAGGISLPDPSPDRVGALVRRLADQPWCGLLFTRDGIGGAFDLAAVGGDHIRAADLVFTLAASPDDPGDCLFAGHIPAGGGMHGGLHQGELANLLAIQGPAFRRGVASPLPCWLPDVAPTLLHLLGLPIEGMDGRVLAEAFGHPDRDPPRIERRQLAAGFGSRQRRIDQWMVDGAAITDRAW